MTTTQQTEPNTSADEARRQLLSGMPVTERRLELAGVSTAFLEGGVGRPILLLHEQAEFAVRWLRVLPDLVETHHVIAPDLPGHGASVVTSKELDEEGVISWLSELIECTCAEPPALVGHMLGGAIAARFAAAHADKISRLVLVDALGLRRFLPTPGFALALVRFIARPSERSRAGLYRHCTVDLDRLRTELGDDWESLEAYAVDRARAPSVKAALRSLMGQFGVPKIPAEDLERIDVPTTLIWGRHDPVTRLRVAEAASERYGWPLHVIDDAGDDPPLETPEEFLQALRADERVEGRQS